MSKTLQSVDVVWFKRDLRITDHKPLVEAQSSGRPIILLYVFEPSVMKADDYGSNHLAFINDSLQHLRLALKRYNAKLHVCLGEMIEVMKEISQHVRIATIHSHREVGNIITYQRDKSVKRWCKQRSIEWNEYSIFEIQRPHPNRDLWAAAWEKEMRHPVVGLKDEELRCFSLPPLQSSLHEPLNHRDIHRPAPATKRQPNRRGQPIVLLDSFLMSRCHNYQKDMSSPELAPRSCSRMSPHLSYGTISIREVVQHTRHFQQNATLAPSHQRSIQSFVSRLHWRGHFMQKLEDQVDIEWRCLDPRTEQLRPAGKNEERLEAWKRGQTGVPMVDACMRFLNHTGWLNFRMRAMLVSFACYNLWLDWREIHPHLAQTFTDYEPGIHLSQLQMQAGTTGINTLRIYNPIRQGQKLDPHGTFVRKWVPEIKDRCDKTLHLPHRQVAQYSLFASPENYPEGIVDVAKSANDAKQIMYKMRQEPTDAIEEILRKHASRRKRRKPQKHRKTAKRNQ